MLSVRHMHSDEMHSAEAVLQCTVAGHCANSRCLTFAETTLSLLSVCAGTVCTATLMLSVRDALCQKQCCSALLPVTVQAADA